MSDVNRSTIGFQNAISICLSKFFDFKGRASRPEHWWFILFTFLFSSGCLLIAESLYHLANFVFIVPSLAVGARRLHDTNRSGWWQLLYLTIVGFIIVIIWLALAGNQGRNKYGAAA